jgi:hypothetical protein
MSGKAGSVYSEMKAFFREVFYILCMVIAVVYEIAAATIAVAIPIRQLTDPQA